MKIRTAIGLGALLAVSTPCFSETQLLVEYNKVNFDDTLVDVSPSSFSIGIEYDFNEHFSVLGKYGIGVQDDTGNTFFGDAQVDIDNLYGVYFKAGILPDAVAKPYALIGYTKTKLTANFNGLKFGQSEDDISYAVGVEFDVAEKFILNLDYSQLIDNSDVDMSSFNLGVKYEF